MCHPGAHGVREIICGLNTGGPREALEGIRLERHPVPTCDILPIYAAWRRRHSVDAEGKKPFRSPFLQAGRQMPREQVIGLQNVVLGPVHIQARLAQGFL